MEEDRVAAVEALIATARRRYPDKGFSISDKLDFVPTADRGLCVRAKVAIRKDETLLVVPESARLGREWMLADDKPMRVKVTRLRREIQRVGQRHQRLQRYLSAEDVLLAVSVMKVLAARCRGGTSKGDWRINVDQAATWPSEAEMRRNSWFYWDVEGVRGIWNASAMFFSFEELRRHVRSAFDDALLPFFRDNRPDEYIDASLPSNASGENDDNAALWNTFVYSLALSWSRSHDGRDDCPEMIPLIELFNGHSERIDQVLKKSSARKTVINLGIAWGYWPFIGGDRFINECNLACSAVYAARDIDEGDELILTYGDVSPTGFAAKYGSIPADFLDHHNILSDVSMWTPPQFMPTDGMRMKCLEKSGYPLDTLRRTEGDTAIVNLSHERDDVEAYRAGHYEPENLKGMRQFLIVAELADDFELERNFNTGRLRGPLYEARVLRLMQEVADYNIGLLTGDGEMATSAQDVERASSDDLPQWEKSCLLARVAYRESLLVWRHAFGQRQITSPTIFKEDSDEEREAVRDGCRVCGRSYPSKNCGRCRKVSYCSRGHQGLDWKVHKSQCA